MRRYSMISVRAIYENGKITLLEKIPGIKKAKVIVTILEDEETIEQEANSSLFDDIVGAVSFRCDGSVRHDKYLNENNS
jgi:hypothetical protein